MKPLIKKIIREGDFDWVTDLHSEDENLFIEAMGQIEKMKKSLVSLENHLSKVKTPVIKKFKLGETYGLEPVPSIRRNILKLESILKTFTTGFNKVDWENIVVSEELGNFFVGDNEYYLENYINRMEDMEMEPNIKNNHPYKVSEKFAEKISADDGVMDNLIWIMDVNPTDNMVHYEYSDPISGAYSASFNISDIRHVGEDYLEFVWD